jgi:hypothetical protein
MASLQKSFGRRDGSGSSELVNLIVVDRLLGIVGDESDHMDRTAVLVEDQDVTSPRGHLISHIGFRSTLSADRRAVSRSSAWASLAMRVVRRRERTEQHGCHRRTLKTPADSVLRSWMFAAATPLVHVWPAQAPRQVCRNGARIRVLRTRDTRHAAFTHRVTMYSLTMYSLTRNERGNARGAPRPAAPRGRADPSSLRLRNGVAEGPA